MAKYGILKATVTDPNTLTGLDDELTCIFSAPLEIRSNQPSYSNDTINLKRKSLYTGIQRWEISTNIAPTETSKEYLTHSIMMGHTTSFYVRMPQIFRRGVHKFTSGYAISPYNNNAIAGTDGIALQGPSLGTQLMPVGEFIRFSNHSKVYLITDSFIYLGVSCIKIAPKLQVAVTTADNLYYDTRVALRCKYDSESILGLSYSDGILTDISSVKLIEAL